MKKTILLFSQERELQEAFFDLLSEEFYIVKAFNQKELEVNISLADLLVVDLVSLGEEILPSIQTMINLTPVCVRLEKKKQELLQKILDYGINEFFITQEEIPFVIRKMKQTIQLREDLNELKKVKKVKEQETRKVSVKNNIPFERSQNDLRQFYEHRQILKNFYEMISTEGNTSDLYKRFARVFRNLVRVSRVIIFTKDKNQGDFRHAASVGMNSDTVIDDRISRENSLIDRLFCTGSIIRKENLLESDLEEDHEILNWLEEMHVDLIIPFIGEESLSGFLACNGKVSGEEFSVDELDFLFMLADNVVRLSNNQRLYHQVIEQKETIGNIIQNVSSGILVVNINGEIQHCNTKANEIFFLQENVIGNDLSTLPKEISSLLSQTLQEGKVFSRHELFIKSLDKEIGIGVAPLVENNCKKGCIAIFSDITPIKRIQKEEKLADKFDFLGRIAARSSHELKNCLVSIKTFTQLLPERYVDENFRRDFFQVVNHEVDRLNRLVDSFMFFSKQIEIAPVWTDLEKIVKLSIEDLSDIDWEKRSLEVSVDSLAKDIFADKTLMEKALKNIILNAAQSIQTQGKILIKAERIEDDDSDKWIEFLIKDSGSGISVENKESIFEPFFTTKTRGVGLGLTLAKKIVEEHGGEISVESQKDVGTKVTILLPYFDKPKTKQSLVQEKETAARE